MLLEPITAAEDDVDDLYIKDERIHTKYSHNLILNKWTEDINGAK